jgi:transmembrane sensor
MKRKSPFSNSDDSRLENLLGRYFKKAEETGVEGSGEFDSQGVFQRIKNNISAKRRQVIIFRSAAAAAVIILLLGSIALWQQRPAKQAAVAVMMEKTTGAGHTSQLQLADGSTVWLNAGSTVRYPAAFATDKREVFLEGEAFFEVSKDAAKPFLVHTGNITTRVLGTSFNVATYPENKQVAVTVLTGKVSVGNNQLTPRQQATCSQDGKTVALYENIDPGEITGWKEHKIIYNNKPLSQLAASLERWYGITIRLDAPVANCIVSADFTGEPVANVVAVLARLVNGKVERKNGSYHITGEGCNN